MGKSYRKPYSAVCGVGDSAHHDKTLAARGLRRGQNTALRNHKFDWDEFLIPERYECSWNNTYSWNRDGRQTLQFPPKPPIPGIWNGYFRSEERAYERYQYNLLWYARLQRK